MAAAGHLADSCTAGPPACLPAWLQGQGPAAGARQQAGHRHCGAGGGAHARCCLQGAPPPPRLQAGLPAGPWCQRGGVVACLPAESVSVLNTCAVADCWVPCVRCCCRCRHCSPPCACWMVPCLQDAEERQSEALEIALLNRSIKNRGAPAAEDPNSSPGGWVHAWPACQLALQMLCGNCGHRAQPIAARVESPRCWQAQSLGGACTSPHTCPALPYPAWPFPAVPPAGRALDAAEHLLVKCRPLSQQWGCERFGLADPAVLQAIEVGVPTARRGGVWWGGGMSWVPAGCRQVWTCPPLPVPPHLQGLPGAEACSSYTFVDARPGGWVAEARRLNAELAAHGKKQLPIDPRRLSADGGGGGASGGARKRPPRPSRKEAEENAVKRVGGGRGSALGAVLSGSAKSQLLLLLLAGHGVPVAAHTRVLTPATAALSCLPLPPPPPCAQVIDSIVKHVEQEEIKCYTGKCYPLLSITCVCPGNPCPQACCGVLRPLPMPPGALCFRVPAALWLPAAHRPAQPCCPALPPPSCPACS